MMRFILVSLVILMAWVAQLVPARGVHRQVWLEICDLVEEKFYRDDPELASWVGECRRRAHDVGLFLSRREFMNEVQVVLSEMGVSHLMVYDPEEDRRLWRGEAVDTGIRVRSIEGRWIISKVWSGSAADQAQLQAGDEVLFIENQVPKSAWQIESSTGWYEVERSGSARIRVYISAKPLKVDREPNLSKISDRLALLEITSFRGEYFADSIWKKIANQLGSFDRVIVDLRDNSGGNLVAMLRALSPFLCESARVGTLSQPRRSVDLGPAPQNDLDEMKQLKWLEKYREVPLNTYTDYGCYRGEVLVLTDHHTASVSEIFADAIRTRPRTQILGTATAGDVVLATWYGLSLLGAGYSLSIPEAVYLSAKGELLEGGGVWPDQNLSYELGDALRGEDTWVKRAIQISLDKSR